MVRDGLFRMDLYRLPSVVNLGIRPFAAAWTISHFSQNDFLTGCNVRRDQCVSYRMKLFRCWRRMIGLKTYRNWNIRLLERAPNHRGRSLNRPTSPQSFYGFVKIGEQAWFRTLSAMKPRINWPVASALSPYLISWRKGRFWKRCGRRMETN